MTFINDMTMYCVVCGGPIYPRGGNGDEDWISQVVLLHAQDDRDVDFELLEMSANNKCGPFFILNTGEEVTACNVPDWGQKYPPLYFPCHIACVTITKLAIAMSRQDESSSDRSLQHLWRVLKRDWKTVVDNNGGTLPCTNLMNASKYGNLWVHQESVWDTGPIAEDAKESFPHIFVADPMKVPSMTELLLSYLELVENSETEKIVAEKHRKTDESILTSIMDQLNWLGEHSLQCTGTNPSADWLQCTLQYAILPWFWDLDYNALRKKEAAKPGGKEWNWELWVRQWSQPDISEIGHVFDDLPLGIRNRRRIWRLVEDLLSASSHYKPSDRIHNPFSIFGED